MSIACRQATAQAYGPVATPHVFIFDHDRKLRTLAGCGGKGPPRVHGKVTWHRTPLAGQTLVLFSEGGAGELAFAGTVTTPGTYKVAIEESLAVQEKGRAADKALAEIKQR